MRYINYHKHSCYSNIRTPDSVEKMSAYMKRAKELGSNIYSTVEHGYQGNIFETITQCEANGMDYIFGAEMYYVPSYEENEEGKRDKSNNHIIVIAKTNKGFKEINKALSIANIDGFYHKPRINDDILFNLFTVGDVIITSACVAGIASRPDVDDLVRRLKDRFGSDFYLEVQNHNQEIQIKHNKKVLELAKKYCIEIIHANDSHYIDEVGKKYREVFLNAKGFNYPEENSFELDYPSSDEIFKRYKEQGVLSEIQVQRALENTLVFERCVNVADINKEIKIPKMSDNPTEELKDIINTEFKKRGFNKLPKEQKNKMLEAVRTEMKTIIDTKMENYFIMDYKIVKLAQEKYGGLVTRTGRGSAVSFVINHLLGLTEINRVFAPVPLYPSRFMSTERILSANSLPDIDINVAQQTPFIQATEDLLGVENCAWMISYKPLQEKSAFRLYCKGKGLNIQEYDEVAKDLDLYREDIKWKGLIEESNYLIGVIESVAPSPCSMLIYNKDVSKEIGLIKLKDKQNKTERICCLLDGVNCDAYKYLKNDILKVDVLEIIDKVCKMANIPIPNIKELEEKLDKKTWDIYAKGITCTVNQADSDFATNLVKEYKPHSVAEMSAFVRAIRPGFASLLNNFIKRKPYTTNVKELDELLEDSFHYLMYQESIMKYLIWLGIDESKTYTLLKKIAKKKFKPEELKELHTTLKENWINKLKTDKNFEETWQVVNDASKYSFNASHSLSYAYDSIYCAYLKSHYPLEYYAVAFDMYSDDTTKTAKMTNELRYFNIKLENPSFENADYTYSVDKNKRIIYKGMNSIKNLNEKCCLKLKELSKDKPETFTDLLFEVQGYANSRHMKILISLGFFNCYGKSKKLMQIYEFYRQVYNKSQLSKDKFLECDSIIKCLSSESIIRKYAKKETKKLFKEIDVIGLCKDIERTTSNEELGVKEIVSCYFENVGSCDLKFNNVDKWDCIIVSKPVRYKNYTRLKLYNLNVGKSCDFKISNSTIDESGSNLNCYDMLNIKFLEKKPKFKKDSEGKWYKDKNDLETWVLDYIKIEDK